MANFLRARTPVVFIIGNIKHTQSKQKSTIALLIHIAHLQQLPTFCHSPFIYATVYSLAMAHYYFFTDLLLR
jgi:hypothetical protein